MINSVEHVILTESPEQIESRLNFLIENCKKENLIKENNISDGYHTFGELYEFRKLYNAALFNEWGNPNTIRKHLDPSSFDGVGSVTGIKYDVHKSMRHNDGELCFGGGWFIVVAILPGGQISNHYKMEDWDLFKVPETVIAKYEFDGHTPQDVLERLKQITEK
jgi:hypothetical protein